MRANYKGFNISIKENYQAEMSKQNVVPQDLSRAVLNIMNNACYAVWSKTQSVADDSYHPQISVDVTADDHEYRIVITDNGEGMTDEVKQKLYENFFTTKPAGQGTGLGMAITRQIIEEKHHGRIEFDSKLGEFTTFSLILPYKK
jgi:signal transduction histidine kinase